MGPREIITSTEVRIGLITRITSVVECQPPNWLDAWLLLSGYSWKFGNVAKEFTNRLEIHRSREFLWTSSEVFRLPPRKGKKNISNCSYLRKNCNLCLERNFVQNLFVEDFDIQLLIVFPTDESFQKYFFLYNAWRPTANASKRKRAAIASTRWRGWQPCPRLSSPSSGSVSTRPARKRLCDIVQFFSAANLHSSDPRAFFRNLCALCTSETNHF